MSLLMQTACVEMSVSDRRLVSRPWTLLVDHCRARRQSTWAAEVLSRLYAVRQSHPVRASPR